MTHDLASSLLAGLPDRRGFGDASLIRFAPGSVNLGGGNPDTAVLPTDLYREAMLDLSADPRTFGPTLRYPAAAGTAALRETIAAREGVEAERVIVTSGGIHGLALAVLGTLDAGDTVVVDDPVFPLFLRVLDLVGVRVEPLRVQSDGIDVEELERRLSAGFRPKALFTVATFHNPTGVTLSVQKAARLVELAERYGFVVFADDPYKEIAFPGTAVPDRASFLASDRVIQVGTFSKTLGPGLRLGWNVVPRPIASGYVKLRNRLDGQASALLQEIVVRMLNHEEFPDRIAAASAHYAGKARVLAEALDALLPGELSFEAPTGGFFLWAQFRDSSADFARLFDVAQEKGVTYQRGEWFEVGDEGRATGAVRLSFSEPDAAELVAGAERLADAWREVHG